MGSASTKTELNPEVWSFDIIKCITDHLSEVDRTQFLSVRKDLHSCKDQFIYKTTVRLGKILECDYYHCFQSIIVRDSDLQLAKEKGITIFPRALVNLTLKGSKFRFGHWIKNKLKTKRSLFGLNSWFGDQKNFQNLVVGRKCDITSFPSQIKNLSWFSNRQINSEILPPGIESLKVDHYFQDEPFVVPESIEHLNVGKDCFLYSYYGTVTIIPRTLKTLNIDSNHFLLKYSGGKNVYCTVKGKYEFTLPFMKESVKRYDPYGHL